MAFLDRLDRAWSLNRSNLCVGLDPDPPKMPSRFSSQPNGIADFCIDIIDATADLVCAFKPQIAYFAAQRAEDQLETICNYIRSSHPDVVLILDATRGDIGSTAANYAIEAFERFGADAVTVNPYLGTDSVEPFFEAGGGVIGLCRTSNPGGDDLQMLDVNKDRKRMKMSSGGIAEKRREEAAKKSGKKVKKGELVEANKGKAVRKKK